MYEASVLMAGLITCVVFSPVVLTWCYRLMPSGHPDLDFSVYPQSELMTGRQRGESWKASKLLQSHYQNSSPPKLNNFGVGSQLSMP